MELIIGGINIPLNRGSYDVEYKDVAEIYQTESGNTQRNIVREGVPSISVSLVCEDDLLSTLRQLKSKWSLEFSYFDPMNKDMTTHDGYIDSFKANLKFASDKRKVWSVSFKLEVY